ncbi:chemotaxis protein CheW [Carboxylicivirga marina]|uniref:Purine-binding chemotaxis protein CheW n=1 Tax=Carboxylicivirga marina TaxID=2800988 RepID=A0ABS1HPF8_9BACT|nr:chemotaxis protein CheW [Carboxylicivirga marina]MBK3519578.1 purine-binding chemotaxis protein CheW [Carboxylicivirga marina]
MDKNESKSYLTFCLQEESFTVNVGSVLEIIEIGEEYGITSVPNTQDFVEGVVNFRGNVLPIVNARLKFSLDNYQDKERYVIIVLNLEKENESFMVGLMVDKVDDVIEVNEKDVQPVPEIGKGYNTEYIDGVLLHDSKFIMMMNIEEVIETEDVIALKDEMADAEQKELNEITE